MHEQVLFFKTFLIFNFFLNTLITLYTFQKRKILKQLFFNFILKKIKRKEMTLYILFALLIVTRLINLIRGDECDLDLNLEKVSYSFC